MIEVILLERVERLGNLGQVVRVRPGFARNFLLPKKKALRATKENLDHFEKQRAAYEAQNAAARGKAEKLAASLDGLKLVVIRQASEMGHLYGSVGARDIVEAAQEANQNIERTQVLIDAPIKSIGLFPVKVRLHPEVTVKVIVNVARSTEEAIVQAEKGAAVTKAAEEKAEVEAAFGAPVEEAPAEEEAEKPAKKAKKAKAGDESGETAEADAPKAKKPRAKKAAAE